jgi:hypothetical protein
LAEENGLMTGLREAIAIGDIVRVTGGPFDAWLGEVLSLPENDRIRILISMAARDVNIEIPASAAVLVERAADRRPKPLCTGKMESAHERRR